MLVEQRRHARLPHGHSDLETGDAWLRDLEQRLAEPRPIGVLTELAPDACVVEGPDVYERLLYYLPRSPRGAAVPAEYGNVVAEVEDPLDGQGQLLDVEIDRAEHPVGDLSGPAVRPLGPVGHAKCFVPLDVTEEREGRRQLSCGDGAVKAVDLIGVCGGHVLLLRDMRLLASCAQACHCADSAGAASSSWPRVRS